MSLWIPIGLSVVVLFAVSRTERVHRGSLITPSPSKELPNKGGDAIVGDQVVLRFDRPTDLQEAGVPAQFARAAFLTIDAASEQNVSGPIVAYTTEGVDVLTEAIDLFQRGRPSQDIETPGTRFLSPPSEPITVLRRAISAVYRKGQRIA